MFSKLKTQKGISTLGAALTIPSLLILTGLAMDMGHIIRSRNALQIGVEAALRCVYPVDGSCNEVSADSPTPLYNVTQYSGDSIELTNLEKYEAVATTIGKPQYEYANPTARILDQVHYKQNVYSYTTNERRVPTLGVRPINVVRAFIPFIDGTVPSDATFTYKETGEPYAPLVSLGGLGSLNTILRESDRFVTKQNTFKELGYIEFTIPNPHPYNPEIYRDVECARSTEFNRGPSADHHAGNVACAGMPNYMQQYANVVIHLRGNSNGSRNGTEGKVMLRVEAAPGSGVSYNKLLGGRHYMSRADYKDASLVPRGAYGPAFVKKGYSDSYEELLLHGQIKIKYDTPYRLVLSLTSMGGANGRVFYNPTDVRIFGTSFTTDSAADVTCNGGIKPSQTENIQACDTNRTIIETRVQRGMPHTRSARINLGSYEQRQTNPDTLVAQTVGSPIDYDEPVESVTQENRTENCSPSNKGVSTQADADGYVRGSAEAMQICAPEGSEPSDIAWSEKDIVLPVRKTIVKNDCNHNPTWAEMFPELNDYPKSSEGNIHFTGLSSEEIFTEDRDPAQVLADDYNCESFGGNFALKSVRYDENTVDAAITPLFDGFQAPLGCDYEDILKKEAIEKLGLNPDAYFKAEPPVTGGVMAVGDDVPSCVTTWFSAGGESNGIDLGVHTLESVPESCSTEGNRCELAFAKFDKDTLDQDGNSDTAYAAHDIALPQIQAINPKAKWGCSEPDCYTVNVDVSDGAVEARGSTTIKLNTLLGKTLTLHYNNNYKLERGF